jgi:hypothetical protein
MFAQSIKNNSHNLSRNGLFLCEIGYIFKIQSIYLEHFYIFFIYIISFSVFLCKFYYLFLRAMRNRGIEIYVTGPEEEGCSVPSLDLHALLMSAGIFSHGEQSTLIAVHHAMRAISTGK